MAAKPKEKYIATEPLMANRKVIKMGEAYTPRSNAERDQLLEAGQIVTEAEWKPMLEEKKRDALVAAGLEQPEAAPAEPAKGENNPAE